MPVHHQPARGRLRAVLRLATFFAWLPIAIAWWGLPVGAQDAADPVVRIGVIGLDTSHSVAFTRLIQSDQSPFDGYRVTVAFPRGSADIESSVSRIPKYTEQMQALGVEIAPSLEALIEQVDAVLLETNDGRPHLEQVLPVLRAGKPVFVDKPLAASLVDVVAIQSAAAHFQTPLFTSSSLRFAPEALAARSGEAVGPVLGATTFSPAKREATHPDFYWYGIHGVEQLFTVMGPGCIAVNRTTTDTTDLVVGRWQDGRIGTFRGFREGPSPYGGNVFGQKGQANTGGNPGYENLVREILMFFETGQPPVDPQETLEIYAFMTAADRSLETGAEVNLAEVIGEARQAAPQRLRELGFQEEADGDCACCQTDSEIILSQDGQEVLRYAIATRSPPPGIEPVYARSGYLHPIRTPSGRIVSGDFARDHAHQHGLFLAWVNTQLGDRSLDFWNQRKQTAGIRHQAVAEVLSDQDACGFQVELHHEEYAEPQRRLVLRERWQVQLQVGGDTFHCFDLASHQRLETDLPLLLKRHVYGGLGLRGSNDWRREESKAAFEKWERNPESAPPGRDVMGHAFLTSEGKQRHDGNHTPARWAAVYGEVDGKLAGLAVLDHPQNFRHPQLVRLHPNMPYFSYTPVPQQGFQIQPGKQHVSFWRVIAFDGPPDAETLDQQWQRFAELPLPPDPWQVPLKEQSDR